MRRRPQADVQLHRIGPEGTATADGPVNRARFDVARPSSVLHGERNSRTDCGAIGLHTYQTNVDPVVALARVLEEPQGMAVGRYGATDFGDDVLVAVAVQIGESNAVSSSCCSRLITWSQTDCTAGSVQRRLAAWRLSATTVQSEST